MYLLFEWMTAVPHEKLREPVFPPGTIRGSGADAETLIAACIKDAAGIVAGTDNDANNLSIIMTAR